MRSPDPRAVSSRQNPFVDQLKEIRDESGSNARLFIEGPKLLEEALKSGLAIETLAFVPDLLDSPLIQSALPNAADSVQLTPYVMKAVSDVEAPQGIVAVIQKPTWTWDSLTQRNGPLVILDRLQDPGNTATILRTAEAAGVAGLVTTPGTVRLYSPKSLRGAMGASLRLPVLEHVEIPTIVAKAAERGMRLVGAASTAKSSRATLYSDYAWPKPFALILGQESKGLSAEWPEDALEWVSIPMQSPVESLNVAVAAGILLYAARPKT